MALAWPSAWRTRACRRTRGACHGACRRRAWGMPGACRSACRRLAQSMPQCMSERRGKARGIPWHTSTAARGMHARGMPQRMSEACTGHDQRMPCARLRREGPSACRRRAWGMTRTCPSSLTCPRRSRAMPRVWPAAHVGNVHWACPVQARMSEKAHGACPGQRLSEALAWHARGKLQRTSVGCAGHAAGMPGVCPNAWEARASEARVVHAWGIPKYMSLECTGHARSMPRRMLEARTSMPQHMTEARTGHAWGTALRISEACMGHVRGMPGGHVGGAHTCPSKC